MPWQAYIDSSLLCSGLIDHAIVFAKDDNEYRILGSSPGYLVPREELQEVRKIFADAGTGPHIQKARETGFRIAGTNYLSVKGDARSLYGKQGNEGVLIVNTKEATFIVHYPDSSLHAEAANLIEQLCDHLISVGR